MKLLVALDGSPASERALEHALSLAAGNPGALLILLNVQTPDALGLSDIRARSENDRELALRRSAEVLRRPVETCGKHDVACEKRSEYGLGVAETIVRVAREIGADQIVMGARGLGRLRGRTYVGFGDDPGRSPCRCSGHPGEGGAAPTRRSLSGHDAREVGRASPGPRGGPWQMLSPLLALASPEDGTTDAMLKRVLFDCKNGTAKSA